MSRTAQESAAYEDCARVAEEYERTQGKTPNGFSTACRQLAAVFRARAQEFPAPTSTR